MLLQYDLDMNVLIEKSYARKIGEWKAEWVKSMSQRIYYFYSDIWISAKYIMFSPRIATFLQIFFIW